MDNRIGYYDVRAGLPVIVRPSAIVMVTTVDTTPYEHKPEPRRIVANRMVKRYRSKGYPLGKTRRGFKKWLKRFVLKTLDCKSWNEAKRKYRKK